MPGLMNTKNCTVSSAVDIIRRGGVVVFPTETSYGLAADATNARAVRRIFAIKGRTKEKSLPLIATDLRMVGKYAALSPILKRLVKKYWPGPLTVVASCRGRLAPGVVREKTVAIRVSSHPIARALARRLGRPIVSTSANLSGRPACFSVTAVRKQLGDQLDGYLDVGSLPRRCPSTIVAEKNGGIIVLRGGGTRYGP